MCLKVRVCCVNWACPLLPVVLGPASVVAAPVFKPSLFGSSSPYLCFLYHLPPLASIAFVCVLCGCRVAVVWLCGLGFYPLQPYLPLQDDGDVDESSVNLSSDYAPTSARLRFTRMGDVAQVGGAVARVCAARYHPVHASSGVPEKRFGCGARVAFCRSCAACPLSRTPPHFPPPRKQKQSLEPAPVIGFCFSLPVATGPAQV